MGGRPIVQPPQMQDLMSKEDHVYTPKGLQQSKDVQGETSTQSHVSPKLLCQYMAHLRHWKWNIRIGHTLSQQMLGCKKTITINNNINKKSFPKEITFIQPDLINTLVALHYFPHGTHVTLVVATILVHPTPHLSIHEMVIIFQTTIILICRIEGSRERLVTPRTTH